MAANRPSNHGTPPSPQGLPPIIDGSSAQLEQHLATTGSLDNRFMEPKPKPNASASQSPTTQKRRGRKPSLDDETPRNHICQVCSRRFSRRDHLKRHQQTIHDAIKPFECQECSKSFSRRDNLLQHLRLHGLDATVLPPRKFTHYRPQDASSSSQPDANPAAKKDELGPLLEQLHEAATS